MATATAESAVTDPADPADPAAAPKPEPTPAAAPGPLARILTPVEPARPHPPLGSTANMGQQAEVSSKSGNAGSEKNSPASTGKGSPVAALVHAIAARIGRGGGAVKRTHTITETRVSGSTSTGKNDRQARSNNTQAGQHRTNRDHKLADLRNKTQAGKDNRDQKHTTARDARSTAARSGRENRDVRKGDTTDAKTADTKGGPVSKDPDDKSTSGTAAKSTAAAKPTAPASPAADPLKKTDPKGLNAKTKPASEPAAAKPATPEKAAEPRSPTAPATPATQPAPPAASRPRTQTAREAGYRDGTRVAAVAGQARAYKDGAVDGWDDRTAADKAEGKTMTDTRARNAVRPKEAPKLPPASGSTVDLAKKPAPAAAAVPAQVTVVGEKAIEFIADGAAHTMSRGEVRTLKAFERRLAEKKTALGRVAEGSKATRLQAVELATRAQRLAEDAKSVHGGARIVALLSRLAERSRVLRLKAEEIEKNAHRGAEAVKVLAANANTRHGGIYRAVVDSPLTAPAEREFYMDKDGG